MLSVRASNEGWSRCRAAGSGRASVGCRITSRSDSVRSRPPQSIDRSLQRKGRIAARGTELPQFSALAAVGCVGRRVWPQPVADADRGKEPSPAVDVLDRERALCRRIDQPGLESRQLDRRAPPALDEFSRGQLPSRSSMPPKRRHRTQRSTCRVMARAGSSA